MDGDGGDAAKSGKHGGQVCQICGDGVGMLCIVKNNKLGSPPIRGEESEDVDVDDAGDFNYPTPGNQDHKHKIAERMLTWRMNSGASDDVGHAKYDSSEIGHPKYKAFAYFDRNQSGYIEIDELGESLAGGLGPNY